MQCEECGVVPEGEAAGWVGHLAYDPREDEAPYTVFYCPTCAEREFGNATASSESDA